MAWRAFPVFSFLVPEFEGRGRAHLKGAHCERLEVSIAFPGIPFETSRVSETPLLELLNEEDPELLQPLRQVFGASWSVCLGSDAATSISVFFGSPLAAHSQQSSLAGCFFTLEPR